MDQNEYILTISKTGRIEKKMGDVVAYCALVLTKICESGRLLACPDKLG
jgi:hypothetical protein